jgi:RNA polymerase sigma-70 factor (ECF subfamily)
VGISWGVNALAIPAAGPAGCLVSTEGDLARTVERARSGDRRAFEDVYRTTVGRIYALCLRMCGDPQLAEELTQETYIRAWQKLSGFRGDSRFTTWLHRVGINVVLGYLRSTGRRPALEPFETHAAAHHASTGQHPGRALDLERAIAELPPRARTVFVLHDVEGYTHHEIARLAGMAVGTSKAHLSRARGLLRKALTS